MKENNKGKVVLIILAVLLLGYASTQSLVGRIGTFDQTDYLCDGDIDSCRSGATLTCTPKNEGDLCSQSTYCDPPDVFGTCSSGAARAIGYIETIPTCGQYIMSYTIDAGSNQCNSGTRIDMILNGVKVGSYESYDYVENGVTYSVDEDGSYSLDVTSNVAGSDNNSLLVEMQLFHAGDLTRSCGVSVGNVKIESFECPGDKVFKNICPSYNGFAIRSKELGPGETIYLSNFTNESYFCEQFPVMIKDLAGLVVSQNTALYTQLNDQGNITVPLTKSYTFFFMDINLEETINNQEELIILLNNAINQLEAAQNQSLTTYTSTGNTTIDAETILSLISQLEDLQEQRAITQSELEVVEEGKSKQELTLKILIGAVLSLFILNLSGIDVLGKIGLRKPKRLRTRKR